MLRSELGRILSRLYTLLRLATDVRRVEMLDG
jgi:hypothetical protein